MMKRVVVFGDSIEYGAWDTQGGWVERVKQSAHARTVASQGSTKIQIINLGIGGNTSRKILARMKNEIDARHTPSWGLQLVFSFGTNDSRSEDGVTEVSLEEFKENIRLIIEIAKTFTDDIVFVGNPPLGKDAVSFKVFEFTDERVRKYDETLAEVSAKHNIPFVSLRPAYENNSVQLYAYDDIHPNDAGHELIRQLVEPYIFNNDLR